MFSSSFMTAVAMALAAASSSVAQDVAPSTPVSAQPGKPHPYLLGLQGTLVGEAAPPFHSPYSGPNSLVNGKGLSQTYTLFLGAKVFDGLTLTSSRRQRRARLPGRAPALRVIRTAISSGNRAGSRSTWLGRSFVGGQRSARSGSLKSGSAALVISSRRRSPRTGSWSRWVSSP